ncbi:hypothetical protein AAG570_012527 [Ranatra chinensis]|uniref:Uncharacterized protein n=1 Tax=Ranatra chinensis TaxID=642074 RepID=A0ABD0YQM2_9HEMI
MFHKNKTQETTENGKWCICRGCIIGYEMRKGYEDVVFVINIHPPPRAVVAVPPARSRPTDTTTARVIVPIVNHPDNKNKNLSQIKPHIHPAPPSFAQVVSKRKNRPATTTPKSTPQRAQPKTPQTLPPTGPSSTPVAHSSTTTPVFSIQIVTALASFTNEFRTLASDLIVALTSLSSLLTTLTSANLSMYNQYGNQ